MTETLSYRQGLHALPYFFEPPVVISGKSRKFLENNGVYANTDKKRKGAFFMAKKKDTGKVSRLDDMLGRYGELCSQQRAAFILGISPRTVHKMLHDGYLAKVGHRVDVRSICSYIENPTAKYFYGDNKRSFFSASLAGKDGIET